VESLDLHPGSVNRWMGMDGKRQIKSTDKMLPPASYNEKAIITLHIKKPGGKNT
jgi:hypothetical protein